MGVVKLSTAGILDYQKYSSALAGNSPYIPFISDYDLLETEILTGSQATVTFSSLNSTYGADYQHLQIRGVWRTDRAGQPVDTASFKLNSASSFTSHALTGNGSTVTSNADVSQAVAYMGVYTAATGQSTGIFSAWVMDILDPFNTSKNTTTRVLFGLSGSATNAIQLQSQLWPSTTAVDSITFDAIGNFIAGSRLSLYGLKGA
jgi:hypothetical protein